MLSRTRADASDDAEYAPADASRGDGEAGRHCYLELEDGRILFLSGQYLYDNDEDDTTPRFPNRDLLITRLPHAGEILKVERLGDHFSPSVTLPPFTRDDHEHDRVPEDGQILPGPLSRYATLEAPRQ